MYSWFATLIVIISWFKILCRNKYQLNSFGLLTYTMWHLLCIQNLFTFSRMAHRIVESVHAITILFKANFCTARTWICYTNIKLWVNDRWPLGKSPPKKTTEMGGNILNINAYMYGQHVFSLYYKLGWVVAGQLSYTENYISRYM